MFRSEKMSCFKLQIADESVEDVMFTLGQERMTHFEDLNAGGKIEKPFSKNLKRCEELEQKIWEFKEIVNACGSRNMILNNWQSLGC